MKRKIAKYLLPLRIKKQEIELPLNSKILSIQNQDGLVHLWAAIDDTKPLELRIISIVETGEEIPENAIKYISTVVGVDTEWHFFELDS